MTENIFLVFVNACLTACVTGSKSVYMSAVFATNSVPVVVVSTNVVSASGSVSVADLAN